MALSPITGSGFRRVASRDALVAGDDRNDAFSFWKLPEEWRAELAPAIEQSEVVAEMLLSEAYMVDEERRTPSGLRTYYRIKRLIPSGLRHRLNSAAIRARGRPEFPRWPCESALIELRREWLEEALETIGAKGCWHIGFWPQSFSCCIVLTHDVETRKGFERMEAMAEIEERWGFRSAWNLPLAQYEIDWRRVEEMRRRGFEFGAHGLCHDGRLFRSERDFAELSLRLEQLALEHDLRGFRAPSTLRNARLIGAMGFDFDSSFADTDPYEPQPGGTCSLFPFHLSKLIELPYTMPQDHTLLHLLRRNPLPLWVLKANWIAARGGMILTLTHPDYCGWQPELGIYEELLKQLAEIKSAWRATPSQVVQWWRERSALRLRMEQGRPVIRGSAQARAVARQVTGEPSVA